MALYSLGNVPGVDGHYTQTYSYEGLAIIGDTLLLSVASGSTTNQIVWAMPLVRSAGHVVGFGDPSIFAQMQSGPLGNVVSGGLVDTAQGLAYTTQGYSYLGQFNSANPPASSLLDVSGTGVQSGGLEALPGGTPGQYKLSSLSGQWYTVNTTGAFGSYSLASYTQYNVGIAAYAFDYIPAGGPFSTARILVGDPNAQRLDVYSLDAYGNPCNPSQNSSCAPVTHLVASNMGIGYGIVRDPVTGDILFTTQNDKIWDLSVTVPEPSSILLGLGGLGILAWWRRRRSAPANLA